MKVYYDLTPSDGESAVALGNFDGLHLGHRKVISCALEGAKQGLIPTVMTFTVNPKLRKDGFEGILLPLDEKIRLLDAMGIQQLYLLDFDSVKHISPKGFVTDILKNVCKAKKACCGFNYTFGRGGSAGSVDLEKLCAEQGIKTAIAGPVMADGTPVSSTRIRGLIENGRVDEAAHLLARPFGYESEVISGRKLGRKLGTPTLNQTVPEDYVLPKFGVYVSAVTVDGKVYCGVTNVGVKPTVGSSVALAETWMPDYVGPDLYGHTVRVGLLKFLRPERKFPGLAELKAEINHNGEQAREYFRKNPIVSGNL